MKNKLTTKQKAFLYYIKRCGLYTAWASNRKRYFELNSIYYRGFGDTTSLDFINRSNTVSDVIMRSFCWADANLPFHQRKDNEAFWSNVSTMNSNVELLHFKEHKGLFEKNLEVFKRNLNELLINEQI